MITRKKTDKVFEEEDEGAFYNCIVQDLLVRVKVNQRTKLLLQNWHCFQERLCVHTRMIEYKLLQHTHVLKDCPSLDLLILVKSYASDL